MAVAKKMNGLDRREKLLDIGAKLAGKHGAVNVTRRMVATAGKVSDALVAHYFGPTADAQKMYARQAKKMGIEQPAKDKIESIGTKLRAHGPRQPKVAKVAKRTRSIAEVKAIKDKVAVTKKPGEQLSLAQVAKKMGVKPAKKSAARKPKAPPAGVVLPPLPVMGDSA